MSITSYQAFHEGKLGPLIFLYLSPKDQGTLAEADKTWYVTKLRFELQDKQTLKDKIQWKKAITPYQAFHRKNLGPLIIPFLAPEDRRSLGQADKAWKRAKLGFEVQCYQALKDRTHRSKSITSYHARYGKKLMAQLFLFLAEKDQNSLEEVDELQSYLAWRDGTQRTKGLYIKDRNGSHKETLLEVLGSGGSKKIFRLQKGRALAIPNMDQDPLNAIVARWGRIVHEEVAMSQLFSKVGLLSLLLERVSISVSENPREGTIPAYFAETFKSLAKTKGCFIIENNYSSTWKKGRDFLFKSDEERFTEETWDSVMDLALTDIAKIALYNLPISQDALSIAVLREPSPSAVSPYKVRPFCFDFSSKNTPLAIPQIQAKTSTLPNVEDGLYVLYNILHNIFSYEFNNRDSPFTDEGMKILNFRDQLGGKYKKEIASRMQQLLAEQT